MSHFFSFPRHKSSLSALTLGLALALGGCSGSEESSLEEGNTEEAGAAGAAGKGTGGKSSGGSAGKASGGGGQGGKASGGAAGKDGAAGEGGEGGAAGEDGEGGAAGEDGEGGAAGEDGEGGAAGEDGEGGEGGAAGEDGEGGAAGTGAGAGGMGTAGKAGSGTAGGPNTAKFEVDMTFTTANVGRDYKAKSAVQAAFDKVGDVMDGKGGPRFIGWQEIGEGDPCGATCEITLLKARFKSTAGWDTYQPKGKRPDGGLETVKVPITVKDSEDSKVEVRAVYASAGWAGVSPTRFVTVVHYPERNVSTINTHFIAKAWSCGSNEAKRREYWNKAWAVLKAQVAAEHNKGRNVVVTGDLNRARAAGKCNPKWTPTSLHPSAKDVGGTGIDYIFAVPAKGYKFVFLKEGSIAINIDSHKVHWVTGRFVN